MLTYIVRRLLLMLPTLFGITVMVFLIARLAPGRPGESALEGGQMSAEAQKAVREWYEKRYGLDLPLWRQYGRWWKGMFTAETQALAWTEEMPPRPLYTVRQTQAEYFARIPEGGWRRVLDLQEESGRLLVQTDPELARSCAAEAQHWQREVLPGYAEPRHLLTEATLQPLADSLDERLLEPATILRTIEVEAPAWIDLGSDTGYPAYQHPSDPDLVVFRAAAGWRQMRPRSAAVVAINDGSLQRIFGRRVAELGEERDGYALPRHVLLRGASEPCPMSLQEADLVRVRRSAEAQSPTMLWIRADGSGDDFVPVLRATEPPPLLVVRGEDGLWHRFRGASPLTHPQSRIYNAASPEAQARLGERLEADRALHERRDTRHAFLEGREAPVSMALSEGDLRRYRQPITVFEVTLGESNTSHTTVMEELKRRLPVTLLLSLTAFPLIYLIAVPTGMLMAVKRGKRLDSAINLVLLGFWSVPVVLSATLVIGYLAKGGQGVEWFPNNSLSSVGVEDWPFSRWLADRAWHMVLPVLCIVYGGFAYTAKQMRAAMLENFTMDYVRTAKAKGVPFRHIVTRHVLRNSLLPLITIFATVLPVLIAGSVFIEKIFNIEGMGLFTFRAVQNRDYDVVQAMALIFGLLNLAGLLIADVCYALADPRIAYK
ncbi:MAG: ABC transporter permease subunit [Phycisphaerales bacterium JB038]